MSTTPPVVDSRSAETKVREYLEIAVPLEWVDRGRCEQLIRDRVERFAADGWKPGHPLDFESLAREGRVRRRYGFLFRVPAEASVRLRRVAQA